ncbi:MAG: DUF192 domain-containing protein [Pseudomonadota bacterium]
MILSVALAASGAGAAQAPSVEAVADAVARLDACSNESVTVFADTEQRYRVELALTPDEQRRGLMFRQQMDADAGMLFVFEQPRQANFWMRNTFLPLDIIFIDTAGQVLNVGEGVPFSEASVRSDGIAGAVLELNRGEAAAHGIDTGTQLLHPAFREAPEGFRCPESAPFVD